MFHYFPCATSGHIVLSRREDLKSTYKDAPLSLCARAGFLPVDHSNTTEAQPKHSFIFTLNMLISRILVPVALLALSASAQTKCNGRAEFCDLRYPEVIQIGAHDSPFVGPLPQHNQNLEVAEQLDMGIRFLQGQTRNSGGQLNMCHTDCLLEDAGSVESFLSTVKTWMDDHPDEVITLLITNPDGFDIGAFDDAFKGSGIMEYAFVPSTSPDFMDMKSWPTFGELIAEGTRLITFLGG